MRFTSMFRYGLRALAVLAENYGERPVSAKEISTQEDISPSFLEQLLAQLRRNGVIEGVRGPGGGFKLRKHPSKCISCDGNPDEKCSRYEDCSAVPILMNLERDFSRVLDSYTLSDVHVLGTE